MPANIGSCAFWLNLSDAAPTGSLMLQGLPQRGVCVSAGVPKARHLVQARRTLATTSSGRRWETVVAGSTELAFYGEALVRAECVVADGSLGN